MAIETEQDFNHIGIVGWSVIVTVLVFVFWKVWPELKANNIITGAGADHYALSDSTKKKRTMAFSYTVLLTILFSLRDILLFLLGNHRPIGLQFLFPANPPNPHISGLTCFFAAYIGTYIEGVDFSRYRDFRFAARAWLSAILVCSAFLCGYALFRGIKTDNAVNCFFTITRFIHEAGVIILVSAVYSTNYFSCKTWKIARKKKFIFIYTGSAWLATLIILYVLFSSVLITVLCLLFALVLTGSLLFYKMTPVVYSDETSHIAESVDEER